MTQALAFGESIVQTEVIHPCAIIKSGMHDYVQGWNAKACEGKSTALKIDPSFLLVFLCQLYVNYK